MQTTFGIVGSGWRADFFIRAAQLLPEDFTLCGIVTKNAERISEYEAKGFSCFSTYDELLTKTKPEFLVVSVSKTVAGDVSLALLEKGIPVLAETPIADNYEKQKEFYVKMPSGAKYQVAEQYFLRPDHSARLSFIGTGKIGEPCEARISLTNNYHAVSLIRKYLSIGFEPASVSAKSFKIPGYPGFGRKGAPEKEEILYKEHIIATIDFGGKLGIYDFEADQHRSWIRSQQIQIKGVKGEVNNDAIKYMLDYKTPMESGFIRKTNGENENMENCGLKGIIADGAWHYKNPFLYSRLTDDEIAVATCLQKMKSYLQTGTSFYDFAQAAQDTFLSHLIEQSLLSGITVNSTPQIWHKHK